MPQPTHERDAHETAAFFPSARPLGKVRSIMKTTQDRIAQDAHEVDFSEERSSGVMRTLKADPMLGDDPRLAASLVDALDDILRWERANDARATG